MYILAPLNRLSEIEPLLEAGADEFYAGYVSPDWRRDYTALSGPNRRSFIDASFTDFEQLKAVTSRVHKYNIPLYLTLNRAFYSADQYPLLLEDVQRFEDLGVDGLIVADLELLLLLQERKSSIALHLSSLAPALNQETISFYQQFGVTRITLPRCLSTEEIAAITIANPQLKFDVFIFGGKCVNVEGYCSFFHVNKERRWACVSEYTVLPQTKAPPDLIAATRHWQNCPRYLACGICSLTALKKASVTGLKVVGRGAKTKNKVKAIHFVKNALRLTKEVADLNRICPRLYLETFEQNCNPHQCYYPYEGYHG